MVVIIELVSGYLRSEAGKLFDLEVSEVKLISYLLRESGFYYAVAGNKLNAFFEEMIKEASGMLLKDRRRRKTMREKVLQGESYYEMQHFDVQSVA